MEVMPHVTNLTCACVPTLKNVTLPITVHGQFCKPYSIAHVKHGWTVAHLTMCVFCAIAFDARHVFKLAKHFSVINHVLLGLRVHVL